MKKFFNPIIIITLILSACGENTPVQSVDWYKVHDPDRKDMIAKCKASPGELEASPNCINAQQADNEKGNARHDWLNPSLPKKGE